MRVGEGRGYVCVGGSVPDPTDPYTKRTTIRRKEKKKQEEKK